MNILKRLLSVPQQEKTYGGQEMTWDEIFAGVPLAPGSEAAQRRHKELRDKPGEMTEAEEQELNQLFYTMYPQFHPDQRGK